MCSSVRVVQALFLTENLTRGSTIPGSERHARALLKLPTEAQKLQAIAAIVRQGMSVARTERYVEELLTPAREREFRVNVGAFLSNLHQTLTRIQLSGIPAVSERKETDSQIVLTITIPK